MAIRIESIEVENVGIFQGIHRLNLSQDVSPGPNIVVGGNGTGKTTLADSIQLCLTGTLDSYSPILSTKLLDNIQSETETGPNITVTISDPEVPCRYRFSRDFKSSESVIGPNIIVGPLQAEEKQDHQWIRTESTRALNSVFPPSAFSFSKLESQSMMNSKMPDKGLPWDDLLDDITNSARAQSIARDLKQPALYSDKDKFGDVLIYGINLYLNEIGARYRVELFDGVLVGQLPQYDEPGPNLPAGKQTLVGLVTSIVARLAMPASTPFIGDSIFGTLDPQLRRQTCQLIQRLENQALLFSTSAEVEGLDVAPQFELSLDTENLPAVLPRNQ